MGISWDQELPPIYEDVPASPPSYAHGDADIYDGPAIPDYEELLPLDNIVNESTDGAPSRIRLSLADLEQEALVPTRSIGSVASSDDEAVETARPL